MTADPGKSGTEGSPREEDEPDPLIGALISERFRVVSLIARGGMGKVYRAEQDPLGREVALKVLHPNYQGEHDPEFHKRFFLEASICAKLTHPNTVTIFDYGRTDDEVYFIAMELLEGQTLRRVLKTQGALSPARAVHIAAQIARSLREAHSLGVIHRDLKPANIFLVRHDEDEDFVKVLDFGLVKDLAAADEELTQTGLFMGSPKYMAPEQIQGEEVDGRCDVYALSVILYEMLTGKVPFTRSGSMNVLMAHINDPPPLFRESNPDVDVPPALEQVVMKGMAKRPQDRFAGMDELLVALKEAARADSDRVSWLSDTTVSGKRPASVKSGQTARADAGGEDIEVDVDGGPTVTGVAAGQTDSPSSSKRGLWLGLAGGVLLAVVALAFVLTRPGEEPSEDEPAPVATPGETSAQEGADEPAGDEPSGVAAEPAAQQAAAGEEQPAQPAAPATVKLALSSDPSGAMVSVGGRQYGPTPVEVELEGKQAEPGAELTLRFMRRGYRVHTVSRTVEGESLEVDVDLKPRRRVRRGGAGAGSSGSAGTGGASDETGGSGGGSSGEEALGDYKDAPY